MFRALPCLRLILTSCILFKISCDKAHLQSNTPKMNASHTVIKDQLFTVDLKSIALSSLAILISKLLKLLIF